MADNKVPNYLTGLGRYGSGWTGSLRRAQERGAVIVVEDTMIVVRYDKPGNHNRIFRPWVDRKGNRYDSRDCIPVF